jgi:protease-4
MATKNNEIKKKFAAEQPRRPNVLYGIIILIGLFLISSCVAFIISVDSSTQDSGFDFSNGNVVQIPIKGEITGDSGGYGSNVASAQELVAILEEVKKHDNVQGVILEINSPGGSAVASDEIGQAVRSLDVPTVAWIREAGASGAYWIATNSDHIVANRMSITGSIGVYGSYLEFPGLMNRYNVTYRRLVGGKYKDAGVPYRSLTEEEEMIMQAKIDKIHTEFIKEVAQNRNLSEDQVRDLATGMFYLGSEAKDLGLVDELGGKAEAVHYLEGRMGENATIVVYEKQQSLLDYLTGLADHHGYSMGQGWADTVVEKAGRMTITT